MSSSLRAFSQFGVDMLRGFVNTKQISIIEEKKSHK